MTDFLTVEDVNSVVAEYYNVPFWDSIEISTGDSAVDFTDIKYDYLQVDRTYSNGSYTFTISVDNDLWVGKCYFHNANEDYITDATYSNNVITVVSDTPNITANFYLSLQGTFDFQLMEWIITSWTPHFETVWETNNFIFTIQAVNPNFNPNGQTFKLNGVNTICTNNQLSFSIMPSIYLNITVTFEDIGYTMYPMTYLKIVPLHLLTTKLIMGKINTVQINVLGYRNVYTSEFNVNGHYPISNLRTSGYSLYFDIDLRNVSELEVISFKVEYKNGGNYPNRYASETFKITTSYPTITTESELISLFTNGGVGILGTDISLNGNLTLTEDVLLIGNDKILTMVNHKIIVPTNRTLKVEDTIFTGGKHTIHQNKDSNVELTNCTFTNCLADNGHGAVIDCSVDLESLSVPMDFTTVLNGCSISDSAMAIIHGGDLTVTNCQVTGAISNPSYPYFLYQTDGTAVITQSQFNISSDDPIITDVEFNSCIFTCGADALINNLTHEELSKNNVNQFLTDAHNSSRIDLTYYYDAIEDYITLAGRGYCHSVSGVDFVFKTGIIPIRSD